MARLFIHKISQQQQQQKVKQKRKDKYVNKQNQNIKKCRNVINKKKFYPLQKHKMSINKNKKKIMHKTVKYIQI